MDLVSGAGWQFVLKRGYTATSLSLPGHQSPSDYAFHTMNVLRLRGIYLHDMCKHFPRLEQVTIGRICLAKPPTLGSRYYCGECHEGFGMHLYFRAWLSGIKVS